MLTSRCCFVPRRCPADEAHLHLGRLRFSVPESEQWTIHMEDRVLNPADQPKARAQRNLCVFT